MICNSIFLNYFSNWIADVWRKNSMFYSEKNDFSWLICNCRPRALGRQTYRFATKSLILAPNKTIYYLVIIHIILLILFFLKKESIFYILGSFQNTVFTIFFSQQQGSLAHIRFSSTWNFCYWRNIIKINYCMYLE